MRSAIGSLLILAFCSGCATDDTLLGAFERQMKNIGAENYEVIDSREDPKVGLVFYATWSEDFPGQRDEPSASYFERADGRWVANPGTVCKQTGITTLGLPDGDFLYCAVLRDDMNVAGIRLGDKDVPLLKTHGGKRAWYARGATNDLTVYGVLPDGRAVAFN